MEQRETRAPLTQAQQREKIVRSFVRGGRLVSIPVKASKRAVILEYVAEQLFEHGRTYEEREITAILGGLYHDPCMLRRELVDANLLARKADGSVYWRAAQAARE